MSVTLSTQMTILRPWTELMQPKCLTRCLIIEDFGDFSFFLRSAYNPEITASC